MKDEALKIVKILDRHLCAEPLIVDGERISEYVAGIGEAAEEISKLIPSWIPVSERLPEENTEVLFCTQIFNLNGPFCGDYADSRFDAGSWVFNEKEVTHWMPIPKLPEGK